MGRRPGVVMTAFRGIRLKSIIDVGGRDWLVSGPAVARGRSYSATRAVQRLIAAAVTCCLLAAQR